MQLLIWALAMHCSLIAFLNTMKIEFISLKASKFNHFHFAFKTIWAMIKQHPLFSCSETYFWVSIWLICKYLQKPQPLIRNSPIPVELFYLCLSKKCNAKKKLVKLLKLMATLRALYISQCDHSTTITLYNLVVLHFSHEIIASKNIDSRNQASHLIHLDINRLLFELKNEWNFQNVNINNFA